MTKFKARSFKEKIRNAVHGIALALAAEKNLRIHFVIGLLVIILGLLLDVGVEKFCILLLTISFVIITEMANSAIEFTLDALYKNKYSNLVRFAKDISAGAVLFISIVAVVVGLLIFGEKLLMFVV